MEVLPLHGDVSDPDNGHPFLFLLTKEIMSDMLQLVGLYQLWTSFIRGRQAEAYRTFLLRLLHGLGADGYSLVADH